MFTLSNLVTWIVVGLIGGTLAGRLATWERAGFGIWSNLALGCAGAVVGGGVMGAEVGLDRRVREIARRENVRDLGAVTRGRVAGFREMDLGETAVLAGKFGERVKGFDHAGALGPTRADASGVGDDGAFAATESGFTSGPQGGRRG